MHANDPLTASGQNVRVPARMWDPLSVSIHAAVDATVVVGVALGYLPAKGRLPGRDAIETVCSPPIALPATVVRLFLLTPLGGPGPIRNTEIRLFGHPLTFTFAGIVVAQIVESFPFACATHGVQSPLSMAASNRPPG